MNTQKILQRMLLALGRVMPGLFFLLLTRQAEANPTGLTVQSGHATASASGSQLTVTAGNNAVLNWQSFNIAQGETTRFIQPSAASVVWNQIGGQSPSQIYGSLQANGIVVLLNSSGFYFGPNSYVSAAGLVVSTANCLPPQNSGGAWTFNGPPPLASIVNYGQIQIGQHGSCYLIADQVENHGDIETPGGSVGLASGQTVKLSERPDGRGMSMAVTLPKGSVDNYGTLVADAGTISLNARVVNQDGFIQANSVQNVNGVIELVAGDQLNLGADSKILAQGDASAGGSAGGTVTLQSQNSFSDASGSEISVAGGANGGNGGSVEISAPVMSAINSTIDGAAQAGSTGGKLLVDPDNIVVNGTGSGGAPDTLYLNANSSFAGLSSITLMANNDLTVQDTQWNLSQSTGHNSGTLLLEAGGDINVVEQSTLTGILDTQSWSIQMFAGVSVFANTPAGVVVTPGTGSIVVDSDSTFNPAFIQTASGSINLVAGQDITLGFGRVTTTGGGNIEAQALGGNIDNGSYAQGYKFSNSTTSPYTVSTVGGISTVGGGDVTLTAAGDVVSLFPVSGGYYYDGQFIGSQGNSDPVTAGAGAYGAQPGNYTVIAGGNVAGYYMLANGTGKIYAGVQMINGVPQTDGAGNYLLGNSGDAGLTLGAGDAYAPFSLTPLSLGLINGGWNVTAGDSINLQEVNNPNGDFNTRNGAVNHHFDYGAADYLNLAAGNGVELGGSASVLPRLDNYQIPVILPGILDITAGAGGVTLVGDTSPFDRLILFPSPLGSLQITTTDGGSLSGSSPSILNLIVSDSGATSFNDAAASAENIDTGDLFGLADHALTPVHLNSEEPISLNISGSMNDILLGASEAAQIKVGGNMIDCGFQGMNLAAGDTTSINVTGDIQNDAASDISGYTIGGGGIFQIIAHDLDLGSTRGIQSWGVGLYNVAGDYPLASLFNTGPDIQVDLSGDLSMVSSSIASYNGGDISIFAGGNIEAGALNGAAALGARGIYTTEQGNVVVVADGNIDVNGSRIAAYDGGDVTVESLHGNINAGAGGSGFVVVTAFKVDPSTHEVTSVSPTIPGSGILASTYPFDTKQVVGNILVETPNGNIQANAGGIIQLPLNQDQDNSKAILEVLAGYELQAGGNPVTASELSSGTPVEVSPGENIDASGSGIIGENIVAEATGQFIGVVFGQHAVQLTAPQFASLTVLGQTVSTAGNLGGGVTLIGTESVSTGGASGGTILSSDANGGGSSFSQGTAGNATSTAASANDAAAATKAAATDNSAEDDLKKKKPITLARKVSRVTVLLPGQQ